MAGFACAVRKDAVTDALAMMGIVANECDNTVCNLIALNKESWHKYS